MDEKVHEKVMKVNRKEVVEQAQRLSDSTAGGDEAKKPGATVQLEKKSDDAFLRQSKVEEAAGEYALHKEIHATRQRLRQLQLQELEVAENKLKAKLRDLEQKQWIKKIHEGEAVAKAQQHQVELQNKTVNRRAEEHKKPEARAIASFRESANWKEKELLQMKNECETLEWRDAVLRAELQQLTTNHKLLQLDVEKLREHVGRATNERDQAQAQLDAVLHELFQQTEKKAAAKAELDALRERSAVDLAAVREEICGLEEELAQARDKQQSLEVDLEQQREVEAAATVSSEKIQIKKKQAWFAKKKLEK